MAATVRARKPAVRDVFQWLSYLQYPAMLVALGYVFKSGLLMATVKQTGISPIYDLWNYALLYGGVGIGLSSLQDPTKTQNKISLRVWRDPRKGRWMLMLLAAYAFGVMALGLLGAYRAETSIVSQLSLGLVAFGLGMVGLLRTAIEMREHHRLDKHPQHTESGNA